MDQIVNQLLTPVAGGGIVLTALLAFVVRWAEHRMLLRREAERARVTTDETLRASLPESERKFREALSEEIKRLQDQNDRMDRRMRAAEDAEERCRRELALHWNKIVNQHMAIMGLHRRLGMPEPPFRERDEDPTLDPTSQPGIFGGPRSDPPA
jgi:hypothetical protein